MIPSISVHSLLDLDTRDLIVSSGRDVIVFERGASTVIVADHIKVIYRMDGNGCNYQYSYENKSYEEAIDLLKAVLLTLRRVSDVLRG